MGISISRRNRTRFAVLISLVLAVFGCLGDNAGAEEMVESAISRGKTGGMKLCLSQNEADLDEFAQEVVEITAGYEPDADTDNEFRTRRLIVESSVPVYDVTAVEITGGYGNLYVLQYDTVQDAQRACTRLRQTEGVTAVEPDHVIDVMDAVEQVEQVSQKEYLAWGASDIGIDTFTAFLQTECPEPEDITVAVLDTGVDSDLSIFSGRICEGGRNYVSSRINYNTEDDNGHGTMVSSVIADNTTDNVKILPIKVMNRKGEGYDSVILLGMAYAIEYGVDIINMSIGGDAEKSMYMSMMNRAAKEGIPVIAAAGNESTDVASCTPANIESSIAVSSVDSSGNLSSFSNYGSTIDFAAPGEDIRVIGMNAARYIVSGTSFATPYVSSVYALMLMADTEQTAADIYELMKEYAQDLGETGWDSSYGYGRVNLKGLEQEYEGRWLDKSITIAGDVDGDKFLTSVDAYYILCFITGTREPSGKQWEYADVDGDGVVTVLDAWQILRNQS